MHALINGETCDAVSVQDRGFAYGDGVFETIRVVDGHLTLLPLHLDRLRAGLNRLKISWPESLAAQFESEAEAYAGKMGEGVLKMIVSRGSGGRGYAVSRSMEPTRVLLGFPRTEPPERYYRDGVSVRVCEIRLARQPALAGIKHLNRLEQVLARSEWDHDGFQEGLLMDTEGNVTEATAMNLFMVESGSLVTPALNHCGIAGAMRRALMEAFNRRGAPVTEEVFGLERLLAADEIFLCNSVAGVWPVARIDHTELKVGQVTRVAQQISSACLGLATEAEAS